jgi:uncharacterized MAPEG superfamily protein
MPPDAAAALVLYTVQSFAVGKARRKYGIKAPAITGNEDFERVFRAHQNMLENLVVFVPTVYAFSKFVSPKGSLAIGAVWLVGRTLFYVGYTQAASAPSPPPLRLASRRQRSAAPGSWSASSPRRRCLRRSSSRP